jgi:catechol 2,3-dioxygenase-like lactoylglutathione lyase family enzyme
MRIALTSLLVDDQAKAHKFYTDILGFKTSKDIPVGEFRWLTLVSPEGPDNVELSLEPAAYDFAKAYQKALFDAGIPQTAFAVKDAQKEYERLKELGVVFKSAPAAMGPTVAAMFEDTCGNLIQIYQE